MLSISGKCCANFSLKLGFLCFCVEHLLDLDCPLPVLPWLELGGSSVQLVVLLFVPDLRRSADGAGGNGTQGHGGVLGGVPHLRCPRPLLRPSHVRLGRRTTVEKIERDVRRGGEVPEELGAAAHGPALRPAVVAHPAQGPTLLDHQLLSLLLLYRDLGLEIEVLNLPLDALQKLQDEGVKILRVKVSRLHLNLRQGVNILPQIER